MNVLISGLVLHLALEKYEWKSNIVFELVYIDLHMFLMWSDEVWLSTLGC